MFTIHREAKVIARCGRAEVLDGLRRGRFEPTDHYQGPGMREWISLSHFESRRYERSTSTEILAEPPIDTHPLRRSYPRDEPTPHPLLQLLLLPFTPLILAFAGLRRLAEFFGEVVSATVVIAMFLLVVLIIGAVSGLLIYFAPAAAAIGLSLMVNKPRK
jgi:hypothetical protein